VQALEIAIDALDIPAVVPFWRAVFGYVVTTRPLAEGDEVIVVDPAGQGPTVWFQQLDAPRPQRNRIHFDLSLAEDEAEVRIAAALAAGGRLVSDAEARAFWILATRRATRSASAPGRTATDRQVRPLARCPVLRGDGMGSRRLRRPERTTG
jgi:hypothetical protein